MATPDKKNVMRGLPLQYSVAIETRYRDSLELLVAQMTQQTLSAVKELFETDSAKKAETVGMDASISAQARILFNALSKQFTALFTKRGKYLAKSMLSTTSNESEANLKRSITQISKDITLKKPITSTVDDVIRASITENVSLIKTIPQQYFAQIEQQVMRSISTGNGLKDLVPFIEQRGSVTQSRAKLIANDQTKKAYNNINQARMRDAGVKKFEWLHSGGGKEPRAWHKNNWPSGLNGGIFSINDPPVIDKKTGERGIPGQAINCRCVMIPVIELDED